MTEGHPGFLAAIEEIRQMHLKKGADYGAGTDTFANVRASERFGIAPWLGAILRGNDKMSRIQSFAVKGELKNEPLQDSLLDLANYAIIALVLWREQQLQNVGTYAPQPTECTIPETAVGEKYPGCDCFRMEDEGPVCSKHGPGRVPA